ncbi:MAG: DUF896 domain-containing protein [Clostridiales bacterium]|uniref:DUF896 domain-containing protein n=1 Tax=Clostridium sp. N3C TaxID=1776758 RepID=UPI00092E1CDB|nr:DUF896 domain-containing protein [Clostridium sp. N3C]NLZ49116.1 DUF896 domain-containing protein [Clostridiales bacterium]SCN21674.1 hypothetical protein N3C_0359 [Clostridium sp. N3C]
MEQSFNDMVNRINFLYKKSKEVGLTSEELEEQQRLRRKYIDAFKNNLRAQLETIERKTK